MDATYYQRALKSKLLVLAGAAAIALGLCLAPRPVLASELIDGSVEPIMSYSRQADAGMPSPLSWYGERPIRYYSSFSGSVTLMGHQVGWGPNSCDRATGYVNFN